jgi:CRISPR-associated protein (TIGR03986 family)
LLSGRLLVTITARTPLLVRGFGTEDDPEVPTRPAARGDAREPIIPGSAVHGAIRSLHETLTGSCLRAIHDTFVPTYRQTVKNDQISRLRMAIVTESPASSPPWVRLCEPGIPGAQPRLSQDVLQRLHAEHRLRSGDRLSVTRFDDDNLAVDAARDDNGDWVVLISDSGAREPDSEYRAHIRKLTSEQARIPDQVWETYLAAVQGADDLRTAQLTRVPESERYHEVVHPKEGNGPKVVVGERCLARSTVHKGQPWWLLMSGSEIEEIRLGMVWRRPGAISAGERVPPGLLACWDPTNLCPSCRLFGSADTRGVDKGLAYQRSYRGHVRFGDAVAMSATVTDRFQLPPMGMPRPGAGQFYLDNPAEVIGNVGEPPLREWGSAADYPNRRLVRGRKFYWHTSVPAGELPRRGKAREHHQKNRMSVPAVAFTAGSTFQATVMFTDLDRAQLGGLLAALRPGMVLDGDVVLHIGGGRPLGFGSCEISVDPAGSWLSTAPARYRGDSPVPLTDTEQADLVAEFCAEANQELWPALATVLRMDAVDPALVWYPPGKGARGSKEYDEGFEFWKQTTGAELAPEAGVRKGFPLQVLPDVTATDQRVAVVAEAKEARIPATKRPLDQAGEAR